MDGFSNDTVYFNCPEEFMRDDASWKFGHMHIVLSTSDQDVCLDKNIRMSNILRSKGIDHWYDEAKWINHDWPCGEWFSKIYKRLFLIKTLLTKIFNTEKIQLWQKSRNTIWDGRYFPLGIYR